MADVFEAVPEKLLREGLAPSGKELHKEGESVNLRAKR